MSSILNIGVRALTANQGALSTIGNNIANANTPGYSRQSVVLQDVAGQFTGSGYYGKGVEVLTVQRTYSDFLTKQAALSKSVAAADSTRYDNLKQLENVFQGGPDGLGASISNMFNAFSDITNSPTDLTARSVVLARADETAARFRDAFTQLNDLQLGTAGQLKTDVDAVNTLASQIARANDDIARAKGGGHSPNDLMDQRDQMISELNKYVQTTTIPADDGSVNVFLASSQPLVLGTTVSPLTLDKNKINSGIKDPVQSQLGITVGGATNVIDPAMLGGGEIAGLLRYQNTDLVDAANLLGRLALAIGTKLNEQQALGLDLDGLQGTPLFNNLSPIPAAIPAGTNTGNATLSASVHTNPTGTTSFIPSNYDVLFTSATAGTVTRLSDNKPTAFQFTPGAAGSSGTFMFFNPVTSAYDLPAIDGLDLTTPPTAGPTSTVPATGDHFLLKPFSAAAGSITTGFSSPRALAMSSPVMANPASTNKGTLALAGLTAQQTNTNLTQPVTLTFNANGTFNVTGTGTGNPVNQPYTPGQPISFNGWSLTLNGAPQAGDVFTVQAIAPQYQPLDAGNAKAMLDLRDLKMFDQGALTDGFAGLMSTVGIRVQGAKSASTVSTGIATNVEKDRASVSGVNLDEEAAKMLQFQQAYQAAGKMMQVAQNIFDTLMQSLGR
jgi:flagellar hook-associated protein 1 FlgK